jgi:hypothetical protein
VGGVLVGAVEHLGLAGVLVELVGGVIFAKAIAFERADRYVRTGDVPRPGFDPSEDISRAGETQEALVGLLLVGVGITEQALHSVGLSLRPVLPDLIPYFVALACVGAGMLALPGLKRRRIREMLELRVSMKPDDPAWRDEVIDAYSAALDHAGYTREGPENPAMHIQRVLRTGE